MKKAPNNFCPRCHGAVPNAMYKGQYPGALSRRDNYTEICSDCGTLEAMEDFTGRKYIGPVYWDEAKAGKD